MATGEGKLKCPECGQVFLEETFGNSYKRHRKNCQMKEIKAMREEEKRWLGSWKSNSGWVAADSTDDTTTVERYTPLAGVVIVLKPNGTAKYNAKTLKTASHCGEGWLARSLLDAKWSLPRASGDRLSITGLYKVEERCGCRTRRSLTRTPFTVSFSWSQWSTDFAPAFAKLCYHCCSDLHLFKDCPTIQCFSCQQFGHISINCPSAPVDSASPSSFEPETKVF